jgi:hypothetical protein
MNRLLRTAALATLALAGVLTGPGPAAAATLLLCTGSYETTYAPGLTFTPQAVEAETHNTYDTCLLHPTVTSGASQAAYALPAASCLDLLQGTSTGQTTVTWNTGEATTYTWESTAAQVGGSLITTTVGTVTAGKFLGNRVLRQSVAVLAAVESACASAEGLQHETGTVLLTITGR